MTIVNFYFCALATIYTTDGQNKKVEKHTFCMATFLLLLLSPVVVLVIPVWVIYIWLYLPVVLVLLFGSYIAESYNRIDQSRFVRGFANFVTRSLCCYIMIWTIQSATHYACMLYFIPFPISGYEYVNVVAVEWNIRNTHCYLNGIQYDISTALSFASLLL